LKPELELVDTGHDNLDIVEGQCCELGKSALELRQEKRAKDLQLDGERDEVPEEQPLSLRGQSEAGACIVPCKKKS
jgi:hypothetical protein